MFSRIKIFAAYLFAIPLALILGLLAASPGEITFILIGLLLFVLALPLFFKWHHLFLILFWNSAFDAFFLPGQPFFWLLLALISFSLSSLNRVMGQKPFIPVREMNRPLLFLLAVVLFTAWFRGGIGLRSFGAAAHGGKYYLYIVGAIMGYYAFTGGHIPVAKGGKMTALFFLSGTTFALSNLAYGLGESFYFIYYLVPSGGAASQAASDYGLTDIDRLTGLVQFGQSVFCFLLACYGLRQIFNPAKPWRFLLLLAAFAAALFGGFRSAIVIMSLIFLCQFFLEGLYRTRVFAVLLVSGVIGFAGIALYANRMPLSVQRALSFLPINIDASTRADAVSSTDWRLQMWSIVWKEVPKYWLVGKGYSFDATEMDLTTQAVRMGILSSYEESIMAGDYHNGPLSILMPFGIFGVAAVLWVLVAGFRVLYANFRYGDPKLLKANTTLLSFYLAQTVSFLFVFGALSTQLFIFLGVVGFSVSLNGGVARAPKPVLEQVSGSVPPGYAIELA